MYVGFIVTSYLIGFLLAITIEIPFRSMEQYFYDAERQYRLPQNNQFEYENNIVDDGQDPGPSHRESSG